MLDLKAEVYMVVAMPKQFLWAPFEMAIVNIVLSLAFMLMGIMIFQLTPFVALIPLVLGHVALIGIGTRNPHLTTYLQATGKYPPRRRNLQKVHDGAKFVP